MNYQGYILPRRRRPIVNDVILEVMAGDARNVLCEAVEKHHAFILVVGNYGHGFIKGYIWRLATACVLGESILGSNMPCSELARETRA